MMQNKIYEFGVIPHLSSVPTHTDKKNVGDKKKIV